MRCPSCNFENPEGMNFCGKCAAPLALRCPQCGFENPPGFAFCGKCATPLTEGEKEVVSSQLSVVSPQPLVPSPEHPAERRQLTVMFCDLVGSTALSTQLDPEELREVIWAYQQTSAAVIERYGGYIAQYLGDGLLVYFGYPIAHEDDAVRAVRAGLEIIETLRQPVPSPLRGEGQGEGEILSPLQDTPHPNLPPQGGKELRGLQVRIGIHTGLVVVGEVGGGAKHEQLALGETPNIAARVQSQASPNEVVVSAATLRLMHGLFVTEDLGQQALKGISTPMALCRVVEESTAQRRVERETYVGLTPLVGRELEMEMLRDRWRRAVQGAGQGVLLSGEPGIGKSRLVQTLREQVLSDRAIRIELRCSPYHQNSAYYPIIEHLQRFLRFTLQDTPQTKLEKLTQALSSYRFPQVETLPLLAAFLSLPHPEGASPFVMSPQKQKEKMQEAIIAWIVEEAERAPVYCAWEDLHWADPSTLELLTLLLAQVPTARLLMLLTFRPEFTPPWGPRSYLSQLTLSRLGQSHAEAMIEKVTGGKALAPEILQQIVAKTDGVPLFVEELTKMVMEQPVGAIHESPLQLTIPTTLQDALMARLDRLGTVKEIAQMGATIGREFTYDVLQAVSPLTADTLQQGLRQLVETELVYQRGVPPHATYIFKHALVQDTAYQSLLKSTRQQHHRQIARVLEERFAKIEETQPELLAHHCTEAGLIEQAIPYWQQAGQRAVQRSANIEAIVHLTKGLELLRTLPDTLKRTQQELTLQTTLGPALIATKGFGAPEVEKTYSRARELCRQVGETPQLFLVLRGLWAFYNTRAELQTAGELGEQFLSLAQGVQDPALLLEAHRALGRNLFDRGELLLARAHLEQGIALYDPLQHGSHAFLYGYDPGVAGLSCMALVLWHLGYPDEALKRNHEALTLAQELAHPFSLAFAFFFTDRLCQFRRDGQTAQERAEAAIALSREHGFPLFVAEGTILRGWALAEQGQKEEGIAQMCQGMAAWRVTGAEMWQSNFLALLAEVYGKVGQVEEGLAVLAEALAQIDKTGERFYEADLYRIKGELLLAQAGHRLQALGLREKTEEAEECFLKAIEIACRQSAKSLELRAVTSLARLWQQQGKQHEARQLLADIYNWFTEGFDTKDLQEAKALLEELSN
ncbi:MAG: AAA family ATPase [Deltaproteobacteria bacterium]|nr:AAA family ATPase [Deltaproteobacteria bacterium]